jgi:hypothetical protein
MSTLMKYIPIISVLVVQQLAMIIFMRVVRLDIFLSAGLSALIAMIVGLIIYFIQRRIAARKGRV